MLHQTSSQPITDTFATLKGPTGGRRVIAGLRHEIEKVLAPLMWSQHKKEGGRLAQWQVFGDFADRLAIIELAAPIEGLSHTRQSLFFRKVINQALKRSRYAVQLKFLIPYLSRNTPEPVKCEIIDKLAGQIESLGKRSSTRRRAEHLLEGFLHGVRDVDQLSRLCTKTRLVERLSCRGVSEGIKSHLCIAHVTPAFRQIELPRSLGPLATHRLIKERFTQIGTFLDEASSVLTGLKADLGRCWAYKQYAEFISHNRRFLTLRSQEVGEGRNRRAHRIELCNLVIDKLRLERRYAVLLCMPGVQRRLDTHQLPWNRHQVRELSLALKKFPDRELFLTRRIFRVCIFKGDKHWGLADSSGIRLEQAMFESLRKSRGVAGRHKVEGILLHEFGHVLPYYSSADSEPSPSKLTWHINCVSGRRFLFGEFVKMHGWLEVPQSCHQLIPDPLSPSTPVVEIGGGEYPLDTPVIFGGSLVIFSQSGSQKWKSPATKGIRVYMRNAAARSPGPREDSYNPYEEWSEAFRTYVQSPISLLRSAPHLAYYFELLFRRYESTPVSELGASLEDLKLARPECYADVCRARAPQLLDHLRMTTELSRSGR
jgi:hypothetical protein